MLFVLWFQWDPENTSKLLELWKEFKYPEDYPFREIGIPHINPALPFEEAMEMKERM